MLGYSRARWTPLSQLPLAGKSVLIVEDEALIALNIESCLQNAGAAVFMANSIVSAQSALDEGIPFDAAVVDLLLADGNASPLIQILSERGIPVVISTGDEVDRGQPALSKAVAVLQKPYAESDLSCGDQSQKTPQHPVGDAMVPVPSKAAYEILMAGQKAREFFARADNPTCARDPRRRVG
jgi:CheY-like chemotaxis protein